MTRELRRQAPISWIYFVQHGETGPIKIGCASDVDRRIQALRAGNPESLYLRASCNGTARDERELHCRFEASCVRGEWFSPTEELQGLIDHLNTGGSL